MRVLIDTNILISSALFPKSTPAQAYISAVTEPNHGLVCKQNIDEMRRIFNRKFPDKVPALESFLASALISLELVETPEEELVAEQKIRDIKDRPILRAAITARADILLTGDKDFLESGIEHPKLMTAAEFLSLPSSR